MTPRNNPNAKVFVVNYMAHDLSDAHRFIGFPGEACHSCSRNHAPLIYVTKGHVPFNPQTLYQMALKLKDFSSDDFLLISGSAVLAAMAMAILKETNDLENVNVLLYNANSNSYDPGRINGYVDFKE